jgi:hypothetical protein
MGVDQRLTALARRYRNTHGDSVSDRTELSNLHRTYSRQVSDSLIEGLSVAAAVDAVYMADEFHLDRVTPQMREAWDMQFSTLNLEDRLSELSELSAEARESAWTGLANGWKGKYFEVWVRDELNGGRDVGGLVLDSGESALLHPDPSNAGFDLMIRDADGVDVELLQLKASRGIREAREALRKYPDYDVISTDEAAVIDVEDRVFGSGITNEEIEDSIREPMESILDSPLEDLAESAIPFLPLVVILSREGVPLIMRRQTAEVAVRNAAERSLKSGVAFGAGSLAVLVGAGFFALPASVLARLGMDRVQVQRRTARKLGAQREQLATISE